MRMPGRTFNSRYWEAVPLSPTDQLSLDPTGRIYQAVHNHNKMRFAPQSKLTQGYGSPETWKAAYQRFAQTQFTQKYQRFWELDEHALTKYGPQGGDVNLLEVLPILEEYYIPRTFQRTDVLDCGLRYLTRVLATRVTQVGYVPVHDYQVRYRGSSAGLPTGGKKGELRSETEGVNLLAVQRPWPEAIGFRRMKNAIRIIFNSATPNVRQLEWIMNSILYWLRAQFPQWFGSWCNPTRYVQPFATRMCNGKYWVETFDFTKCDQHTTLELISTYVYPILETILDGSTALQAEMLLDAAFHSDLYLGEWLLRGKHHLFSGQSPTQIIETIIDILGQLGAVIMVLGPAAVDSAIFLAIGDDQALGLPAKYQEREVLDVRSELLQAYNLSGHVMNEEKSAVCQGELTYCKRLYTATMPKAKDDPDRILGAYPLAYALNSIVNPEDSQPTLGRELVAILQRLDNAAGSPAYVPFVQFVGKRIDKGVSFTDVDVAAINAKDWWQRVYGEPWSPKTSTSYAILRDSNLL